MSDKDKLNTDDAAIPKIVDSALNETIGSEKMVAHPDINPSVEELQEELLNEELKNIENEEDDLNKKTYVKISPTFYVKAAGTEKSEDGEEDIEFFKILNPETNVVERRELTDEEKREVIVHELKASRKVFNPIKQQGNKTTNQFGNKYKQKRKRRNSLTKKSRKANR